MSQKDVCYCTAGNFEGSNFVVFVVNLVKLNNKIGMFILFAHNGIVMHTCEN